MTDKMVQFTDKDGNNIYPVSKLPGNTIVAEDLVQLTTTDLENLTNLITPILLSKVYPIGSIFISTNSTNPGAYLGGTWEAWGTGRTIVGIDTKDTNFNTVEKTGGEATHTLTQAETPAHTHTRGTMNITGKWYITNDINWNSPTDYSGSGAITALNSKRSQYGGHVNTATGVNEPQKDGFELNAANGWTGATSSVGGSGAHNNLQPYITCYMWKRTA